MEKKEFSTKQIYTLALNGTYQNDNSSYPLARIVYGKGSNINNKPMMKRFARRKLISNNLVLALIDAARAKGADPKRIQKYWNTYHCLGKLVISKGRLHGNYCKNRCCTICLAIRKAEIINKYLPVIQTWENPYFVTLTVKAYPKESLPIMIRGMLRAFKQITGKYKKRHQRGKGQKIVALRSLECNFNPKAKTYNPHFHVIVPDMETATTLVVEWQRKWTKKYTSAFAQDYRKINDREKVLIEIIKYGSKIFTEPDVRNKKNSKIPPSIYANALDNILTAFEGHKLLQSYGFRLPKQPEKPKAQTQVLTDFDELNYDILMNDWVNTSTGELFSNYKPSPELSYLLNDINMEKS